MFGETLCAPFMNPHLRIEEVSLSCVSCFYFAKQQGLADNRMLLMGLLVKVKIRLRSKFFMCYGML